MLFLVGFLGLVALGSAIFAMSVLKKSQDRDTDQDGDITNEEDVEDCAVETDPADNVVLVASQDDENNEDIDDIEDIEETNSDDGTYLTKPSDMIVPGNQSTSVKTSDGNISDQAAKTVDYNTKLDSLILIWDEDAEQDPDVKVIKNAENPDLAHVMLNGRILADVNGGGDLSASDIVLVPESTALAASADPTIAALFNAA